MPEVQAENLLSRVHRLEQEVERLKRAVLKQEVTSVSVLPTDKPSTLLRRAKCSLILRTTPFNS